jgi:glutamine amidotransferase-like uncharacterized protein
MKWKIRNPKEDLNLFRISNFFNRGGRYGDSTEKKNIKIETKYAALSSQIESSKLVDLP